MAEDRYSQPLCFRNSGVEILIGFVKSTGSIYGNEVSVRNWLCTFVSSFQTSERLLSCKVMQGCMFVSVIVRVICLILASGTTCQKN